MRRALIGDVRRLAPADLAAALFALPLLSVLALFAAVDGGFRPVVWLPATLFLLALLGLVLAVSRERIRGVPRAALVALALLAGFTVWSFASIAWAGAKGDAWDGANRALLYAIVYALFALWPWRAAGAAVFLGAFSVAVAVIAAAALIRAAAADDPLRSFIGPLFVEPAGYHNANAALLLVAVWPAVFLASRRETPGVARGLLLATAGTLVEIAILSQSRGSLVASAAALALFLAVVPGRLRSVLTLAVLAVVVASALGTLLDVYPAARDGDVAAELVEARTVIGLSALVLFVAGLALGAAERVPVATRVRRAAGVVVVAAAVGTLAVGLAVSAPDDPRDRLSDAWSSFRSGGTPQPSSSHFSSGLGSNRYDFWRVGLAEFRGAPLHGIGADNFAIPYLRERRSDEEPLYAHSVEVQVLAGTGLVGAALLGGFLAMAFFAARPARRLTSFHRGLAATALTASGYWIVHASGDWLWEFPALTAPAIGFLALAATLGRSRPQPSGPASRPPTAAFWAGGGLLCGVAAVSLVLPWLSAKYVEAAATSWRSDPEGAYEALDRARRLNPLSERADLVSGAIASRRREWPRMRAAFLRALERNPRSWYSELELAVAEAQEGRRDSALAHLDRAERLNPREPTIVLVRSRLRNGRPVDPDAIDRLFLQRVEDRTS